VAELEGNSDGLGLRRGRKFGCALRGSRGAESEDDERISETHRKIVAGWSE